MTLRKPVNVEDARALARRLAMDELKRLEKDSKQLEASGGIEIPPWVLAALKSDVEPAEATTCAVEHLTQDELLMSRYLDLKIRDGEVPADLDPRADIADAEALLGPAKRRGAPAD